MSYNPNYIAIIGLGSSHFARRYYGNLSRFLFLQVLRWFTSLRLSSIHYWFMYRCLSSRQTGYPIRRPGDRGILAPPPGFSQLITSFFAWQLLGILRRPFFAWPYYLFHSYAFISNIKWGWEDLNFWPLAYQASALTTWATAPTDI